MFNERITGVLCLILFLCPLAHGSLAFAATDDFPKSEVDRSQLMDLARKFVDTVGTNLEQADAELNKVGAKERRFQKSLATIADGEILIFDIRLAMNSTGTGRKLKISQPVTAYKRKSDVMLSLLDFFSAASFPIKVDGEAGTAEGWYIREDQKFSFDANAGQVVLGDQARSFTGDDVLVQDGEIYVRSALLAQWFNFHEQISVQGQYIDIISEQKWPIQQKVLRELRSAQNQRRRNIPKLPFLEEPYEMIALPNAKVNLSSNLSHRPDTGYHSNQTYSVQTAGDMLGYTSKIGVGGSQKEFVSRITSNFSRRSEDADLLGGLKARFYEFNDVSSVYVPYAGTAAQERGIHLTNTSPDVTYDTSTQVTGTTSPYWDVELFRDNEFLQGAKADENGYYHFDNVTLYAGENRLRVVQYGPFGETKEESKALSVSPGTYGGGLLYDVSLTQQNTQTYSSTPTTDKDRNTPHLAANFERQLTDTIVLREGVNIRSEGGDQKMYLHTGAVKAMDNYVLNADLTTDVEGPFVARATARRSIARTGMSASVEYMTEDFEPGLDQKAIKKPGHISATTDFSTRFTVAGKPTSLTWNELVRHDTTGADTTISKVSGSMQFGKMYAGNSLSLTTGPLADRYGGKLIDGNFYLRGQTQNWTIWRGGTSYRLAPDVAVKSYQLGVSKPLTPTLDGDLYLQRAIFPSPLTSLDARLNWQREKETITSSVSYDTDRQFVATVGMSFSLTRDPASGEIIRTHKALTGNGAISAFVFLDSDGDGVFSEGDEPLPGVEVEAVQGRQKLETTDSGYAFLYGLSTVQVTDVKVHEGLDFEPNWVSGFPGVSIRPRPGHVTHLNFPILRGGEMDGTVYVRTAKGQARPLPNARLYLYDREGMLRAHTRTAPDGYYVFDKIPPAQYWLVADAYDLKQEKALPSVPREFTFGFDGTILYGQDIYFDEGRQDLSLKIAPDMQDYFDANPGIDTGGEGALTVMNLGSYNTRILATLVWYKLKALHGGLIAGAVPLVRPAEINNSARTGLHTLRVILPGAPLKEVYERCEKISRAGFSCGLEHMPKGLPRQTAEAAPKEDEKGFFDFLLFKTSGETQDVQDPAGLPKTG